MILFRKSGGVSFFYSEDKGIAYMVHFFYLDRFALLREPVYGYF